MRNIMFIVFATLSVLFVSCEKNTTITNCTPLGDSTVLQLKYGEKKYFCENDSSCFGFTKLISESRCPADVVCVWAGTAIIELETCGGKEGSLQLEIYHPIEQVINGIRYSVELTGLNPYPSTSHPHDVSEYIATITIKRR